MYLIIEKVYGDIYAYMEDAEHFKKMELHRGRRLPASVLNEECDLSCLPKNSHIVFKIVNSKPKAKPKTKVKNKPKATRKKKKKSRAA